LHRSHPPISTLIPYTTLFRSIIPQFFRNQVGPLFCSERPVHPRRDICSHHRCFYRKRSAPAEWIHQDPVSPPWRQHDQRGRQSLDRKSTRLNSSHVSISYAVF